jgi:hypothetical protein
MDEGPPRGDYSASRIAACHRPGRSSNVGGLE